MDSKLINEWTIIYGRLPNGLLLDKETGEISGIPTETGNFTFTVKVVNLCGEETMEIELFVCAMPEITTAPYFHFIQLEEIEEKILEFEGTQPGVWSAVNLPDGLILSEDGKLTGTPTGYGEIKSEITVTNACGADTVEFLFDLDDVHQIIFEVKDKRTGEHIPDATVICPDLEIENHDNGFYTTILNDGEHPWHVSKEGYFPEEGTVVVEGDEGEDIYVLVELQPTTYELKFIVTYEDTGNPVTDATIGVINSETEQIISLTNKGGGVYSTFVENGKYDWGVSKESYIPVDGDVTINYADEVIEVALIQTTKELIFKVINNGGSFSELHFDNSFDVGGRLINDATVVSGNSLIDLDITNNNDGTYKTEVFSGTYNYAISKEGFITEKGSVVVQSENVEVSVPLSEIVGIITVNATVALSNATCSATISASPVLSGYTYDWSLWNMDTETLISQSLNQTGTTWNMGAMSSGNQNVPLEVRCTVKEPVSSGTASFVCTPLPLWRVTQLNPTLTVNRANIITGETFIATCTNTVGMSPFEYVFEVINRSNGEVIHGPINQDVLNIFEYTPATLGNYGVRCRVNVKNIPVEFYDQTDGLATRLATVSGQTDNIARVDVYDPIVATISTPKLGLMEDEPFVVTCTWSGGLSPFSFIWSMWRKDGSTYTQIGANTTTTSFQYGNGTSALFPTQFATLFTSGEASGIKEVEFRCRVESTSTLFNPRLSCDVVPIVVQIERPPFQFVSITLEGTEPGDGDDGKSPSHFFGTTIKATINFTGGTLPITRYQRRLSTLTNTNGNLIALGDITPLSPTFEFIWPVSNGSTSGNVDHVTLYCTVRDNKNREINGSIIIYNYMFGKLSGIITYNQKKPTGDETLPYVITPYGGVGTVYYSWKIYDNETNELVATIPSIGTQTGTTINYAIPSSLAHYDALIK